MTAPTLEREAPPLGGLNARFLGIELRRVLRNKRTLVFMIVIPIVLYSLLSQQTGTINGSAAVTAKQYYMVSLALYGAMLACTSAGSQVAVERALGWSRQLRLTPLRPPAYIAMKLMTAMILGAAPIIVIYLFGAFKGVQMPTHIWVLTGLAVWIASLVFATLGLFIGYLLPSENVMQILGPVLGVLSIFGGIFFPISILPSTLQTIAKLSPVWGVSSLAHAPLLGGFTWLSVLNIVVWTSLLAIGSVLVFRRDTKRV